MATKKDWKKKLDDLLTKICVVFGILGAGYMFFTGESIGWIVAGFFGGFMIPAIPVGLVQGFIEVHNSKPVYTEQQLKDIAYYGVLSGKYKE